MRFAGKGGPAELEAALRAQLPAGREPAWLRQVHSARVLEACTGESGEGDGLLTSARHLAPAVVTADCVPVLLASEEGLGAVHAGWRGIAAGVVGAALERFRGEVVAWIGPAIGPCCYEVGPEVAEEVAAASEPAVVAAGSGARPHLDLPAAVTAQLRAGGVGEIRHVERCTRCCEEILWSYRREGRRAGRNLALIWRTL